MVKTRANAQLEKVGDAAPPVRQRMRSDLRSEQLLSCAIRVIARNGLGSSGHAAIATDAKVSVPTVFAYFPTRQALLRAVVEDVDRFYGTMAKSVLYAGDDTFGQIFAFVKI